MIEPLGLMLNTLKGLYLAGTHDGFQPGFAHLYLSLFFFFQMLESMLLLVLDEISTGFLSFAII